MAAGLYLVGRFPVVGRQPEAVRVHPGAHDGLCRLRSGGGRWMTRTEAEHQADVDAWHLEPDQPRPSWWPGREVEAG